ncbi:MAG: twin-arginine translocation signal domain-containing protein, partial [Proteobacteria bacterium]|nr:twin-arginine translocation signal domain-containing protein [Pseudomonadota bacterium]
SSGRAQMGDFEMIDARLRDLLDAWATDRRRFLGLLGAAGVTAVPMTRAMAQDDMTYFTRAGYELPEFFQAYIDKHGAPPNITFYGGTDEALAKMRSGFHVDVAHPFLQDVGTWADAEAIQPIDTSRLSNWPDLAPSLADDPGTRSGGQQFFAPNDWGITSVAYR